MKANDFRRIGLSMPGASESAHMGHPDFRVGGKIFATLGYTNEESGVIMLPPDEQERLVRAYPAIFMLIKGAWGRQGVLRLTWKQLMPQRSEALWVRPGARERPCD